MIKVRKTGMKSSHYTTVVLPPCKICSGEATGFHFGVITCEACKAFFRRALVQKKPPKCKKNDQCVISSEKSGNCAACRLKKCRDNGMSKEGIRRGRFSLPLRTRAIVEANNIEEKQRREDAKNQEGIKNQECAKNPENDMLQLGDIFADDFVSSAACFADESLTCSSHSSLSSFSYIDDNEWTDSSPDSTQSCTSTALVPAGTQSIVTSLTPGQETSPRSSPTLAMSLDASLGLVKTSEFEYLIDSLINVQELVYPCLKKYFDQPLDKMHKNIYLEFNRKQEIFEDVFGASGTVSTTEYQQVFAETGLDLDERLHQFNLYGRAMEESIEQYMKFADLIPGFYKLDKSDTTRLAKAGHLEFWFFGSHMLFNKELGVAMCWDGSQNGTKEHMTKFFDKDWIEANFEFADTLNKLKLSFEEIVLIRAIILTSGDRGQLSARSHIHSLQERYFECLRYHLSKSHPVPTKRLYKLFDRLLACRVMTHTNIHVNQKFLSEWGFVMQDYPLWRAMLAFDEL